jgi:hypothetical protein
LPDRSVNTYCIPALILSNNRLLPTCSTFHFLLQMSLKCR